MQLKLSCKVYWFKITSLPFAMSSRIKKEDTQIMFLTCALSRLSLPFAPKSGEETEPQCVLPLLFHTPCLSSFPFFMKHCKDHKGQAFLMQTPLGAL